MKLLIKEILRTFVYRRLGADVADLFITYCYSYYVSDSVPI